MSEIKHDLDHEVYLDPKDGKEHVNHGKMEYTKADLESAHAYMTSTIKMMNQKLVLMIGTLDIKISI